MTYTPKTFNLPVLQGLSEKQIKVHIALYEGYVKHVNLIMEKLGAVREGKLELDSYIVSELRRRFAFDFVARRMHELYSAQLRRSEVGAPTETSGLDDGSALAAEASAKYGSSENFVKHIREVARSRGIGWVVVYADPQAKTIHTVFVGDHEVGQLAGLPILLALDLWEHAYMVDYVPAEKNNYIDAFFANLNWSVVEKRFDPPSPESFGEASATK